MNPGHRLQDQIWPQNKLRIQEKRNFLSSGPATQRYCPQIPPLNNTNMTVNGYSQPQSTANGDILDVIVVGCGLAGLLASIGLRLDGHNVTILEQASSFGEVGAGMRIPPNCFKLLNRWGIDLTYLKKTYSNGNRFLRYTDGESLADMSHGVPEWDFGGSYLMVHRADYHTVLLEKAKSLGVDIKSSSQVESYEWETQTAITTQGLKFSGDLLIVADGKSAHSSARQQSNATDLFVPQACRAKHEHPSRVMSSHLSTRVTQSTACLFRVRTFSPSQSFATSSHSRG